MNNKIQMTQELQKKLEAEIQTACQQALQFADMYFPATLDYSEKSLEGIEYSCDEVEYSMPGGKSTHNINILAWYWGAYIGEIFRRNCGGHWEYWEDEYGKTIALVTPKNGAVFPMSKVQKRLQMGKTENLVQYYQSMKDLYF